VITVFTIAQTITKLVKMEQRICECGPPFPRGPPVGSPPFSVGCLSGEMCILWPEASLCYHCYGRFRV